MGNIAHTASSPIATPPPGRLARRLLVAGICLACMTVVLVFINVRDALNQTDRRLAMGHDLLPSYVAGTFVREGRPRDMYDINAVHREEARIVKSASLMMDRQGGPWLNPPFFAWVFAPLSALPYREAAAMFLSINLLLLGASVMLLCRLLPVTGWRLALVPLFLCTAMPFWQAMCHQQNTLISLCLLSLTITFWLGNKPFAAGITIGLLFFKPQLALAVAIVLIATAGWRAAAGVLSTGAALLALTLVTLPGTLADYVVKLPPILHGLQFNAAYNWGRQVTFQSFWRLISDRHVGGSTQLAPKILTWIGSAAIAALLMVCTRNVLRARDQAGNAARLRDLIAATIISMPLLMPYYMDYDLLLLAVPAVLFAGHWIERRTTPATRLDRWQFALWIAVFFETQINPGLAGQTRFNLAVPILATLCGIALSRCLKPAAAFTEIANDQSLPPTALAA
jgi:hypothetical protein